MRKRLMYRCYDVGYTKAYDLGVFNVIDFGIGSSVDLMFDAGDAIEILQRFKE